MKNIWHIAFAVDVLDRGMAELGDALGVHWRPVHQFNLKMRAGKGALMDVPFHGTFSMEGSPAVEIFQAVPGTPLAQYGANPFHHLGYWSHGRLAEAARLESLNWPCIANAEPPEHRRGISVHRGSQGIAAEICDLSEDRPTMRDLFPPDSPFYVTAGDQ